MSPRLVRRRVVGKSLVGAATKTAVVVGTAGAVSNRQHQKRAHQQAVVQQDMAQQQQLAEMQANQELLAQQQAMLAQQQMVQPAQPEVPPAEPSGKPDLMAQLQQLSQFHSAGILTDEEFTAAKQKLLAS